MLGVMDVLFSLDQVQLPENSKMKFNVDKLVLIFQFQYLYQCSHSQETKNHSMVIWTSMVKMELNSSLNGKLSPLVGKKMPNSPNSQHPSPPLNDLSSRCLLLKIKTKYEFFNPEEVYGSWGREHWSIENQETVDYVREDIVAEWLRR